MTYKELTWINKSGWGEGEFQNEPDKLEWVDEQTGYPCLVVRQPSHGALCGYVGVTESHPWFGINLNQSLSGNGKNYDVPESIINVHGGLTYSDFCQENNKEHGVCHAAISEDDRVFWFGFDCVHWGDLSPAYGHFMPKSNGDIYRNIEYVKREVQSLAQQLHKLQSP